MMYEQISMLRQQVDKDKQFTNETEVRLIRYWSGINKLFEMGKCLVI